MTGHLTRGELEQLVAEDPQFPVPPALRVHVSGCDRCNVRRLALHGSRSRYLAAHPPADFAQAVMARAAAEASVAPSRRKPPIIAFSVGAVALAAAAFMWFRADIDSDPIRLKGGATLEVLARHAGRQRRLRDAESLAPGDQLAFAYALDQPRHLLLLSANDAGEITRYFPAADDADDSLAATPLAQLPIGVELDARKGTQRIYALFSEAALDEAEVRSALRRALEAGGGIASLNAVELAQPTQQRTVWFRKP